MTWRPYMGGIAALVLSAAAEAQPAEDVYTEVVEAGQILAFGTAEEKISAAGKLGDLRAIYSVPFLEQALGDPSPAVRAAAAAALGRIADASAAKVLGKAVIGSDADLATAAAVALGGMHIDSSYKALVSAVGKVEGKVKDAVLDGLREWNEPFTPLPAPNALPEGKEPPPLPGADLPKKPEPPTPIDVTNPYGPSSPSMTPAKPSSAIDEKNPYGSQPYPSSGEVIAALKGEGPIDTTNPYHGIGQEETSAGDIAPEALVDEPERGEQKKAPKPAPAGPAPFLPVEMLCLDPAPFASFEAATAAAGQDRRVTAMQVSGGYVGKHLGGGVDIPFAGGAGPDNAGGFEEWSFGNLGLWLRAHGGWRMPHATVLLGGALTMNLPTSDEIEWSVFGRDPDLLPGLGGLYLRYYEHGAWYPDLQNTFKVSLRPDLDLAVIVGILAFQLELGLDVVVLGKAADDTGYVHDMKDVALLHLGFGSALRPVPWLQVSVEITAVVEMAGTSATSFLLDPAEIGDPAGSEAFVTPALTAIVPVGRSSGLVTLALRFPLGEVGSASGPLDLGPIIVLSTGMRWGAR